MRQLSPIEFTYGKYGTIVVPWATIKSTADYVKWLLEQNIIGYCNSLEIKIRPRTDNIAIMIEKDGWIGWCHILINTWKKYLKQLKINKQNIKRNKENGKSNKRLYLP